MGNFVWADETTTAQAETATSKAEVSMAKSPLKAANELLDAGKYDEAIAAYEAIGTMKFKKAETWRLNNEGLAYIKSGKATDAVPFLEKSVAVQDSNYVAWNNLGIAYEAAEQFDKAKEAYQKSADKAKEAGASSERADANLKYLEARMAKLDSKKDQGASDAAGDTEDSKK
jgi:tetratricopeptide (TPR) repeat protein